MNWIYKQKQLPKKNQWIIYTNGVWFEVARYFGKNNKPCIRENSSIPWHEVSHWMPLEFPGEE